MHSLWRFCDPMIFARDKMLSSICYLKKSCFVCISRKFVVFMQGQNRIQCTLRNSISHHTRLATVGAICV